MRTSPSSFPEGRLGLGMLRKAPLVGKSSRSPHDTQTQVPASSAVTKGQWGRWWAGKENPFLPCSFSRLRPTLHFSLVQSLIRVWLFRPTDCSTPGFPVHYQLPELAWVPSRLQRQLHSYSRNLPQGLWFSRCYCRFRFSVLWLKPTDLYYVYTHIYIIFNL